MNPRDLIRMNTRLNRERQGIEEIKDIHNAFDIYKKKNNETLTLNLKKITNFGFTISIEQHFKFNKFYFDNLPPEINNKINSYVDNYIKLEFYVSIIDEFPFKAPPLRIKCIEMKNVSSDVIKYYKNKIDIFLCRISYNWVPGMKLNKYVMILIGILDFHKLHDIINKKEKYYENEFLDDPKFIIWKENRRLECELEY